jgi:hypothetical protein
MMGRLLGRPLAVRQIGLVALVMAIVFADSLTRNLQRILRFEGSFDTFLALQGVSTLQILPMAMPVIVFLVVANVVRGARESRMLIVLSAAGRNPARVVSTVTGFTILTSIVSLFIDLELNPRANLVSRELIHEMRRAAFVAAQSNSSDIIEPLRIGDIYMITGAGDLAVAATRDSDILLLNHGTSALWRVAVAKDTALLDPWETLNLSTVIAFVPRHLADGTRNVGTLNAREVSLVLSEDTMSWTFNDRVRQNEVALSDCLSNRCPPRNRWVNAVLLASMVVIAGFWGLLASMGRSLPSLLVYGAGLIVCVLAARFAMLAVGAAPLYLIPLGFGLSAIPLLLLYLRRRAFILPDEHSK